MRSDLHKAWTGGSGARPLRECSDLEREYSRRLYREAVAEWCEFWGREDFDTDTARLFWNRARLDAHATFREIERTAKV